MHKLKLKFNGINLFSHLLCNIYTFSRFQELKEHHDDRTETMLKIYEDSPAKIDTVKTGAD